MGPPFPPGQGPSAGQSGDPGRAQPRTWLEDTCGCTWGTHLLLLVFSKSVRAVPLTRLQMKDWDPRFWGSWGARALRLGADLGSEGQMLRACTGCCCICPTVSCLRRGARGGPVRVQRLFRPYHQQEGAKRPQPRVRVSWAEMELHS